MSIVSPDSQPHSPSFSDSNVTDYGLVNLFNGNWPDEVTTPVEQNEAAVASHSTPASPRFSYYFPRFWTCNVRGGITSKIDEIAEVIVINKIDVAVLVETWLHGGIHDDLIRIPGYFAFRKDRGDSRSGGGILIYVIDGMPCQPVPQVDNPDFEVLWLIYRRHLMPREVSHILIGGCIIRPHPIMHGCSIT